MPLAGAEQRGSKPRVNPPELGTTSKCRGASLGLGPGPPPLGSKPHVTSASALLGAALHHCPHCPCHPALLSPGSALTEDIIHLLVYYMQNKLF